MSSFFKHLALKEWPFAVVPRPEFCTFIAGRPQLREDMRFLLESLSRRDTSSIHVLWSWLGAGKTHALYFLANEARKMSSADTPVRLMPIYTEFPKNASNFVDVYRSLLPRIPQTAVVDAFFETSTEPLHEEILLECPDLATALRIVAIDNDPQRKSTAIRWMRGDRLPISEFRRIGIAERLDSTDRAILVLSLLIRLLTESARLHGQQGIRVVWMIDEFQRLSRANSRTVADVNAGLQSLFNACPVGLSEIISFSGAPQERSLPRGFSPELRDRIGTTKVLILPPLQPSEALTFVRELLAEFRLDGARVSPFFPFSEHACRRVIHFLNSKTDLRPRALMHAFNAILEAADVRIQGGELADITPEFVDEVLANYVVLSEDDSEGA